MNKKIATVPARVPKPKINVAINALTNVGKVRNILNKNLLTAATGLLITLEAAKYAAGTAAIEPSMEPNNDILIVSINGCQIKSIHSHFGGIIWSIMTKNSLFRDTVTAHFEI